MCGQITQEPVTQKMRGARGLSDMRDLSPLRPGNVKQGIKINCDYIEGVETSICRA